MSVFLYQAEQLQGFSMYASSDSPNPRLSNTKTKLASFTIPIANVPNGINVDFNTPTIGR